MTREYYLEYAKNEREHWWYLAREQILKCLIAAELGGTKSRAIKILNVGAATGRSSEWLAQFGTVTSIEYDSECAQLARDLTGFRVMEGDVTRLDFETESFDLVCALDVIEHVEAESQAVAELIRVCGPSGAVIITVPALQWLWSEHDEINHHFRRYNARRLRRLFTPFATLGDLNLLSYFNSLLFPPVALHRLVRKVLAFLNPPSAAKAPVSDFARDRANLLGTLLQRVFASERHLLTRGWRFPFGVSLVAVWRRSK